MLDIFKRLMNLRSTNQIFLSNFFWDDITTFCGATAILVWLFWIPRLRASPLVYDGFQIFLFGTEIPKHFSRTLITTRVCGYVMFSVTSVSLSVFLSVQAITFEPLEIETSFLVCSNIFTISRSSLSIKVEVI